MQYTTAYLTEMAIESAKQDVRERAAATAAFSDFACAAISR
jgi:hypothetical protein